VLSTGLEHQAKRWARPHKLQRVDELLDRVVNERWTIRRLEAHAKQVVAELGRVLDTAGGAATTNDEAPPA